MVILLFSFLGVACARTEAAKAKPTTVSSASPDASADEALGALSKKGKAAEIERQIQQLQGEEESERAFREIRQREREEDERRIQRSITEDKILTT